MRKDMTRLELIDAAFDAQMYIKQLRGVICAISERVGKNDNEKSWEIDALLTLACLAYNQLEPAVHASGKELEGNVHD
ncbi:hypothetical protein EYZ00_08580 [Hafnia paralvei]|uniref:hypothetical protein n=1 Tax=Hafnia paralvei TaxID=546367 RepID=UPI0010342589|nr:hypothetical protein [Hafnia paralvei]TBL54239.1 hypothetical protein EYZ00_08580 [Hafnia paralvei]